MRGENVRQSAPMADDEVEPEPELLPEPKIDLLNKLQQPRLQWVYEIIKLVGVVLFLLFVGMVVGATATRHRWAPHNLLLRTLYGDNQFAYPLVSDQYRQDCISVYHKQQMGHDITFIIQSLQWHIIQAGGSFKSLGAPHLGIPFCLGVVWTNLSAPPFIFANAEYVSRLGTKVDLLEWDVLYSKSSASRRTRASTVIVKHIIPGTGSATQRETTLTNETAIAFQHLDEILHDSFYPDA